MELVLEREGCTDHSTYGRLLLNGIFECYTLEDPTREVPGRPVTEWKVPGQTAIPVGRFAVTIAPSPKRGGRRMPLLIGVRGFRGIQIHAGNTALDTEGCILVGTFRENADTLRGSRDAFGKFFAKLDAAIRRREAVWIEIRNPL